MADIPADMPGTTAPATKLTTTKRAWAEAGRFLTGQTSHPGRDRLPPGQHLVKNWPVLDLGIQPEVAPADWHLDVSGAVEHPTTWSWEAFSAAPQSEIVSDIHCVTTWSRYDNSWRGVRTRDLLDRVAPRPDARFVILHSHDGYTTNLPLADFASEAALLAHSWEGKPLTAEHGGPVRLVVPHLYLWKSAKWLRGIEFTIEDRPGFWEERGYHDRGDPWQEERYSE
jgi:DMSO/TMAO reductase YedYZ molybdopterin-dependent catalytic subunit